MKNSQISKLEKQFDISIFDYVQFSGNGYKCSFKYVSSPEPGINRTRCVIVRRSETIEQAISRSF
jgi:hypothetical protein